MSQECREACGGQGLKTENRVGHLKGEFDVQSTFEGDNNVLMQQVFLEYYLGLSLNLCKTCIRIKARVAALVWVDKFCMMGIFLDMKE